MIALPTGWRLPFIVGLVAGALVAWAPASCVGKSQANQRAAIINAATAAKLQAAAADATRAAALTELSLTVRTAEQVRELREVAKNEATNDNAGPGVDAVMQRLRVRAAR